MSMSVVTAVVMCILFASAAQAGGTILYTADGGASWSAQTVPSGTGYLTAVWAEDAGYEDEAWACGEDGTIIHTTNNGVSWHKEQISCSGDLYDIYFEGQTGLVVGENGSIWKTTNSGTTWQPMYSGVTTDLYDVSGMCGWICITGQYGAYLYGFLSGSTWTPENPGTSVDITAWGNSNGCQNGLAVGDSGLILYRERHETPVPHSHWYTRSSGTTRNLNAVTDYFHALGVTPFAVGNRGTIVHSSDFIGTTWTVVPSGVQSNLFGCYMGYGGSPAIAVGTIGCILRSTDSGFTWSTVSSGTTDVLSDVHFHRGEVNGWAVGGQPDVPTPSLAGSDASPAMEVELETPRSTSSGLEITVSSPGEVSSHDVEISVYDLAGRLMGSASAQLSSSPCCVRVGFASGHAGPAVLLVLVTDRSTGIPLATGRAFVD
jgi:photosystem II stability/assembly factor-like uncharacterized protein